MPSWVAPSVAAEIWGISVDQVLAGIADGSIHSFVDGQFLFVDIRGTGLAAESEESVSAKNIVTEEEFAALTFQPISEVSESNFADEEGHEEETNGRDVGSWRDARKQSAQMRRPPAQAA